MMRALRTLRDDRGIAAIEFALIVPVLIGLLLFGVDGWMRIDAASKMRSGLQAGARYYQSGGSDDVAAANLAMQAWAAAPGDAQVNAVRSCECGGTSASCGSLCANNNLPNAFVSLTATGTYTGFLHSQSLTESDAVRIR
jgi:Flp pilus assembly protein TadG